MKVKAMTTYRIEKDYRVIADNDADYGYSFENKPTYYLDRVWLGQDNLIHVKPIMSSKKYKKCLKLKERLEQQKE